jgi:hypothetical protein
MLMYDTALSSDNHLRIDVMGSAEQLTVGLKGTPQLLQTEHVDSMHAHDTVMGLEFRDVLSLGANGERQLTFLFAPRGAAAVGPVPFMHRESAEANPDAPLGHALQDGFHDVSTVLGFAYGRGRTTAEATAFSGHDIHWPFPMHKPDSYGLRVNQSLDDHVGVGASYADVRLPDDVGGTTHHQFVSAWLTTSHRIRGDDLKSSFVWGQHRASQATSLNSFLAEAVYQHGRNKLFGRAESLQLMPEQLDITPAPRGGARWVEALTLGYERTLIKKDNIALHLGGSYTQDIVPPAFQPAYGAAPGGAKVYARLVIDGRL